MNKDTVQTKAQATLETLLEEYKPIYEKYVLGKNQGNGVIDASCATVFFAGCAGAAAAFQQIVPVISVTPYITTTFCALATISFVVMSVFGSMTTDRAESVKSPEQIRRSFDETPFCEVEECDVTYETVAQRNQDTISIRLLAEDQPSFLVSLRGPHGPITRHDLVQNFTLINEDAKQPTGPYPGITHQQCQDFPKKLNLTHLRIHMFPNIFTPDCEEHSPWSFMIPNADARKEIKDAFELLCSTIQRSIVIDDLKWAIEHNRPIPGDGAYKAAYYKRRIITYLQGNPSGTNADTINDLVDKIEAVVTDENALPSAKANAIEMHSTTTSSEA